MHIWTRLYIYLKCAHVGQDTYGNRYFSERKKARSKPHKRRFVLYAGTAEASKVPATWHAWLHYSQDVVPKNCDAQMHQPNLTGTPFAYNPKQFHRTADGKTINPDYTAWVPQSSEK